MTPVEFSSARIPASIISEVISISSAGLSGDSVSSSGRYVMYTMSDCGSRHLKSEVVGRDLFLTRGPY
jgi:hypothetical protein